MAALKRKVKCSYIAAGKAYKNWVLPFFTNVRNTLILLVGLDSVFTLFNCSLVNFTCDVKVLLL